MSSTKKVVSIRVIDSGSNPDIDTDFHTEHRAEVIDHVTGKYGDDKVSGVITFQSLAAKGAFKSMCTIYEVPFAAANKLSGLIPPNKNGVDYSFNDLFDVNSPRYQEGEQFRSAITDKKWTAIIEGARNIEGRYKSTGVHPCGYIISSRSLDETIPLQIRQGETKTTTQWTYQDCEEMGLIKFDFLGLNTVDLIMRTVDYIRSNGKTPPNMVELIHGEMDDPKTYKMFASGNTVGVFQFGTDLVEDYCRVMKPSKFEDLTATTALCRPGPMGVSAHMSYAHRKNGREKIDSIHPTFDGSPLDAILEDTYGLIVYQEHVMRIAVDICGFTLKESDDLRRAMGKKKKSVMDSMRPKFFEGGKERGYSEEGLQKLWDTIYFFSEYAFNKSHSVGYAMLGYQSGFLKANYPVEFMAALIAQSIDDKAKTLSYLKEAARLGVKVGSVDANASGVEVAPDTSGLTDFDVVYGFSGLKSISKDVAELIVAERNENGDFVSVDDFVSRCYSRGITKITVFANLASAGAFDKFVSSRKSVLEKLPGIIKNAKTNESKGDSLFELDEDLAIKTTFDDQDFSHTERLRREADVAGFYLTDHPLSRVRKDVASTTAKELLESASTVRTELIGCVVDIENKTSKKGNRTIKVTIDDGTGFFEAQLAPSLCQGMTKFARRQEIEAFVQKNGKGAIPNQELIAGATKPEDVEAIPDLTVNEVYTMTVLFRPGDDERPYSARIETITKLTLAHDGRLPVRVRIAKSASHTADKVRERFTVFAQEIAKRTESDSETYPVIVSIFDKSEQFKKNNQYYLRLGAGEDAERETSFDKHDEKSLAESLDYVDIGVEVSKNARVDEILSSRLGFERVDFGMFRESKEQE